MFGMVLMGLACMFTACSDDRDSNPIFSTSSMPGSFSLNKPSYLNQTVALNGTSELPITWSQPQYTADNAPLNITYILQYSFQKKDGTDTVVIESKGLECKSSISTSAMRENMQNSIGYDSLSVPSQVPVKVWVNSYIEEGSDTLAGSLLCSDTLLLSVAPYWVKPAETKASYLWMPGDGNGWDHSVCPVLISEKGNGKYVGYGYIGNEFKFTETASWGKELNAGSFDDSKTDDIFGVGSGTGNITCSAPGFYYITVDVKNKSIKATEVTWYICGEFCGSDWSLSNIKPLTYNTDEHCLEIDYDISGEWKFLMDGSWDVNLGGSLDDLVLNGSNLNASGSKIQLFIENAKAKYTAKVQ